ncbi:MAG: Guanine nucleotide binding protein (G protein), beta polypeptide 1-like [Bathelium mastoideum]|nr:MAG: Guanine nucleotide binding protein (G protein), beta polypeptide 1-like [Bathelium mastoideum]
MTDATPLLGAQSESRPDQGRIHAATLLPPAQPVYVLRGHCSAIHAVAFVRHNSRLLVGDADGWASLWSLASKRAVAVWRAHRAAVLGLTEWGDENIISQGRDGRLIVWQLRAIDEETLEKKLPVDGACDEQKQPWVLHCLTVNTINFCAFSACSNHGELSVPASPGTAGSRAETLFIAVPAVKDGQVDIFRLPDEHRLSTIPGVENVKTGMVMAVNIFTHADLTRVAIGYENGSVALFSYDSSHGRWTVDYHEPVHSQPVLSIDVAPMLGLFYSSSADAIIAQHSLSRQNEKGRTSLHKIDTKHSGQQALTVRSDERILATAGWDSRVRVYSAKTLKELVVLKWHKQGCYALSFAVLHGSVDTLYARDGNAPVQTVQRRRKAEAESTHWLAAGSKDGKVSLWNIY